MEIFHIQCDKIEPNTVVLLESNRYSGFTLNPLFKVPASSPPQSD